MSQNSNSHITTLTSLAIVNNPETAGSSNASVRAWNGFYAPNMTTTQRDAIVAFPNGALKTGAIIYNTTVSKYQLYQGFTLAAGSTPSWVNLITIPSIAAGDIAAFEGANTTPGTMYVNSTTNAFRVRTNAWLTVTAA